ncbi:hypothetical protein BC834DRAFT_972367 [Gloeopeniophorella convolvens]|nr:hypothetical protein BC834DRAFT_972367 [Gloeopeniophorella convolvens]
MSSGRKLSPPIYGPPRKRVKRSGTRRLTTTMEIYMTLTSNGDEDWATSEEDSESGKSSEIGAHRTGSSNGKANRRLWNGAARSMNTVAHALASPHIDAPEWRAYMYATTLRTVNKADLYSGPCQQAGQEVSPDDDENSDTTNPDESVSGKSFYDVPDHIEDLVEALLALETRRGENHASREVVRSAKAKVDKLKEEHSKADEALKSEVARYRGLAHGDCPVRYSVEEGPGGSYALIRRDLVGSCIEVAMVKAQFDWKEKELEDVKEALIDARDNREEARGNLERAKQDFVQAVNSCEAATADQPSANEEVKGILCHIKAVGLPEERFRPTGRPS